MLTKINDAFSAIAAQGLDPRVCQAQADSAVLAYQRAEQELATATAEYSSSTNNNGDHGERHASTTGPHVPYQLRLNRLVVARRNVSTAASNAARMSLLATRVCAIASPTPQVKAALALLRKILRNRSNDASNSGQAVGAEAEDNMGGVVVRFRNCIPAILNMILLIRFILSFAISI